MKDKEFKDMTLNELLESDLSLDDIDEVIEERSETKTEEQRKDEKRGLYPQYEDCSN